MGKCQQNQRHHGVDTVTASAYFHVLIESVNQRILRPRHLLRLQVPLTPSAEAVLQIEAGLGTTNKKTDHVPSQPRSDRL